MLVVWNSFKKEDERPYTQEDFNRFYGFTYTEEDFKKDLLTLGKIYYNLPTWDKEFYGLSIMESICAVAVPFNQQLKSFREDVDRYGKYKLEIIK